MTRPQNRAPLDWGWPEMPPVQRGRVNAVLPKLHIGDTRIRYVNAEDGHLVIWTTERLYARGDFAAFLINENDEVIDKLLAPVKDDCRAMAVIWTFTHSPDWTYKISEEP